MDKIILKDDFPFKDIELEFKDMGMNIKYYKKPKMIKDVDIFDLKILQ